MFFSLLFRVFSGDGFNKLCGGLVFAFFKARVRESLLTG